MMSKTKSKCARLSALVLSMLVFVTAFLGYAMADSNKCFASDNYNIDAKADSMQYVYDGASILSDSAEEKLAKMCKEASLDCGVWFVIVTMNTGLDYSAMDNYLEQFIYSYGYTGDYIAYGIDMISRADRIITGGRGQSDISQGDLDDIRKDCEEQLSDGDYYDGCKIFVKKCRIKLTNDIWAKLTYNIGIKIIISLVIAVVVVLIMMASAKAKMTVAPTTYTRNHNFKVNNSNDVFINTTVVTRHIESSSGSHGGGGGGNHGSGGHF